MLHYIIIIMKRLYMVDGGSGSRDYYEYVVYVRSLIPEEFVIGLSGEVSRDFKAWLDRLLDKSEP